MSRKVFTLEINDEVQKKSAPAKKTEPKALKNSANFEFGVAEINNSSAKKRVQKKAELGYEKNVCQASKKPIKSKVEAVDDYFDFCFKKPAKTIALAEKPELAKTNIVAEVKVQETLENKPATTKTALKKTAEKKESAKAKTVKEKPAKTTTAKSTTKKTVAKASSTKTTTKKMTAIKTVVEKEANNAKTDIATFERDEDADIMKVMSIARMGALFDCEKGYE